jgi:hypothetical protein
LPVETYELLDDLTDDVIGKWGVQHRRHHFPERENRGKLRKIPLRPANDLALHGRSFLSKRASDPQIGFDIMKETGIAKPPVFCQSSNDQGILGIVLDQ